MASQWTISHRKQLTPPVLSHMAPGHTETQRSQETLGLVPPSVSRCRKPACGAKKCLTHSTFSAHQHAPWNKGICLSSNAHVLTLTPTFPHHPFSLSSHLVWSKAFPVHLLSHPPRWLSNKSCYLVASRWESEVNLFRKARCGLSRAAVLDLRPETWTHEKRVFKLETWSGEGILAQDFTLTGIVFSSI